MATTITGLDRMIQDPASISGRSWALLANHAAVTSDLVPARAALATAAGSSPSLLLVPEHGLDGIQQDMEAVTDERDPLTGAPVRSLYGSNAASLEPEAHDLEDLDVLLIDVPDIGTRYYTFAATMDAVCAAACRRQLPVIVLDRPNPINGIHREGGAVRPGFESFVSQLPTPVRHGLTLGEIALLLKRERYPDLELSIVPVEGWQRHQWWDDTGLPWVPPSPNMPAIDTAAIYPGLCLVEATELSEGRGTTRPFHLVGAPWVDAEVASNRLRGLELPGIGFRAARFRPMFGKHAGQVCSGVEIHVIRREQIAPLALGLHLLRVFHDLGPELFQWRRDPYEFVADVPALDLLTGSSDARKLIESGGDFEDLFTNWNDEVAEFERGLEGILLYS